MQRAKDREIFFAARQSNVVVMTKDEDFPRLLDEFGPPPSVIWLTCGNTSNAALRFILARHLFKALDMIRQGESLVEISGDP